jgi:hypothetical protein
MKLNLSEEARNYVKITYDTNHFEVNFGKENPLSRKYYSVDDMMKEFHENKIVSADFDDEAHKMFNKGL